jgi:hypothetical protein
MRFIFSPFWRWIYVNQGPQRWPGFWRFHARLRPGQTTWSLLTEHKRGKVMGMIAKSDLKGTPLIS